VLWQKKYIEQVRYNLPEMRGYALHMPRNQWLYTVEQGARTTRFGSIETKVLGQAQALLSAMVFGLHEPTAFSGEITEQDFVVVDNTGDPHPALTIEGEIDGANVFSLPAAVSAGGMTPIKAVFPVGALPAGTHRLTLRVVEQKKMQSENEYDFYIAKRESLAAPISVLGDAAFVFSKALGVKIVPFNESSPSTLLIVAPGALDAAKVKPWVENGGRVLILEQPPGTPNPWSDERVEKATPFSVASPVVKNDHAVMRLLSPRQFSYWRAGAVTHDSVLPSITAQTLVIGLAKISRSGGLSQMKLGTLAMMGSAGKGKYLWTQQKIMENLNDAAAFAVMKNYLKCLME